MADTFVPVIRALFSVSNFKNELPSFISSGVKIPKNPFLVRAYSY